MQFKPMTAEELKSFSLLPMGTYPFEVIEAEEKVSKSGNEMVALKLRVWPHDGSERIIFDYLVANVPYKIRNFCESTELLDKYETGQLHAHDMLNKCGRLVLTVQKDKEGKYPDKNAVKNYKAPAIETEVSYAKDELNDDIPF